MEDVEGEKEESDERGSDIRVDRSRLPDLDVIKSAL